MIYFTSDTHFGHRGILRYQRGNHFSSVEEMDKYLVDIWNKTIPKNALVYHLGDFSFKGTGYTRDILKSLNGRIHLIRGNHDKGLSKTLCEEFMWVKDMYTVKHEGRKYVLCHFPLLSWDMMHYGTIHLHGHCHGNLTVDEGKRFDVGVDTNPYYAPYSILNINAKADSREVVAVDHHD